MVIKLIDLLRRLLRRNLTWTKGSSRIDLKRGLSKDDVQCSPLYPVHLTCQSCLVQGSWSSVPQQLLQTSLNIGQNFEVNFIALQWLYAQESRCELLYKVGSLSLFSEKRDRWLSLGDRVDGTQISPSKLVFSYSERVQMIGGMDLKCPLPCW